MRQIAILTIGLLFYAEVDGKPRYFHSATLLSAEETGPDELYKIDSPLGIFTAKYKLSKPQRSPRLIPGGIRVSVDRNAQAGDPLYLLLDGREFKAIILERRAHPPPPPVP